MINNKITIVCILIFLVVSSTLIMPANSEDIKINFGEQKLQINLNETTNDTCIIEGFMICWISGKYNSKKTGSYWNLTLDSDTNSIRVTGFAIIMVGDSGFPGFRSVKVHNVRAGDFCGVCSNGHVWGRGMGVQVIPNHTFCSTF